MPRSPIFISSSEAMERRAAKVARGLPELYGNPIRLDICPGLRDSRGPVHAGSFLRRRKISFDCSASEFPRIFIHEVFHFIWARAGNPLRWSYEELVAREFHTRARGELGWSAEWRKAALTADDVRRRTRRWREYCCESFCDTAAWLYSGTARHAEFTLVSRFRPARKDWFHKRLGSRPLSI